MTTSVILRPVSWPKDLDFRFPKIGDLWHRNVITVDRERYAASVTKTVLSGFFIRRILKPYRTPESRSSMITEKQTIGTIPALLFGAPSDRLFLYVHGKGSRKEEAEMLAREVVPRGYRVTVMKDGKHYFHTPDQLRFPENWLGEQDYQ